MRINKHDTNGVKPLLGKGELGYDDYTAGGDAGRVYVGTGTDNIALAEKLEANIMTKAQFNALAEERRANRAGSGFGNFGKGSSTTTVNVNEGIWTDATQANRFYIGKTTSNSGSSITNDAQSVVNGVLQKLQNINNGSLSIADIILPTAPTIYPSTTTLTAEQIASGVIKHADSSNSGLIVNGKFDTDTSGWTSEAGAILSTDAGRLKITNNSGSLYSKSVQVLATVIGKEYLLEVSCSNGTDDVRMQVQNYTTSASLVGGDLNPSNKVGYQIKFVATSLLTRLTFYIASTTLGAYTFVDNIAVYPADAISRSDLVFLESWHEDVSEKNFVYPLGNVQYLGANTDGLTGIINGAFTGFETYSLFGNWQASSALIGKGYVWSTLTEVQKKAFIANPDNNCYLDGDKVIQVRYRIRVVQGWGDSWVEVSTNSSLIYNSNITNVALKGKSVSVISDFVGDSSARFISYNNSVAVSQTSVGAFAPYNSSNSAYEGKCYALPIALVHRRNQGAYHPVYNPNGTAAITYTTAAGGWNVSSSTKWFQTNSFIPLNISDCFKNATTGTEEGVWLGTAGSIAKGSIWCGRSDGLFYDQVHESDILDLRNSSKKVEDYNRLINREFNKLVAGTYRGKEGELTTYVRNFNMDYNAGGNFTYLYNITLTQAESDFINRNKKIYLPDGTGVAIRANVFIQANTVTTINLEYGTGNYSSIDAFYTVSNTTRTKSNTLLHCDIIGNPANYPTSWKQSGVFGTPLIVAEDGASLLPTGSLTSFKVSRKANATPLLVLKSTDSGTTWTALTVTTHYTFNTTTNAITMVTAPATTDLIMVYYQTHTSMAVPTVNSEVLDIGDVCATNAHGANVGAYLHQSLTGKIGVYSSPLVKFQYTKLVSYAIRVWSSNKLSADSDNSATIHNQIDLLSNSNPAVKVFPYLTRTNGKAYLNLVFKEMKYNGTTWGDDSKFNIVDNVSTTTDNNAQTVLIGQKTVELPYFIAGDE